MLIDSALHVLARCAVRLQPPLRAKSIVDAVGRLLPPLSVGEAMRIAQEMEGAGTCLTRALAIAARLPGSEVVLGSNGSGAEFVGHAWVELDGRLIAGDIPARHELTRLRRC